MKQLLVNEVLHINLTPEDQRCDWSCQAAGSLCTRDHAHHQQLDPSSVFSHFSMDELSEQVFYTATIVAIMDHVQHRDEHLLASL